MERVLIEELVNARQYHFTLHFELPLNLSMALHPKVTGKVENVRQNLRPEGLMISGELVEKVHFAIGGNVKELDHSFHFTYLISKQDLLEANLLNFEVQVAIEQIQYHLIKKNGHVLLKQRFEMKVDLAEYHLRDQSLLPIGGMQKRTGIFLKPIGKCQKNFLKLYPIRLPDDFSLLSKLSGIVDQKEIEVTPEGCLLDLNSRIQAEYVTEEQKLGTFFFERKENFFLPLSSDLQGSVDEVKVEVELSEISLEKEGEVVILYHCQIFLYQKSEVDYFTGNETELPPGAQWKQIEVEQVGNPIIASRMLEEELDLTDLPIKQVTGVTGLCVFLKVEEGLEQLFLTGELEYQIIYLTEEGIEQTRSLSQVVEEMILIPNQGGAWHFIADVQIPDWHFLDGKIYFDAMIDFQGAYHERRIEPILVQLPECLEEVIQESFYLTEEMGGDELQFQNNEKIYLQRYASQILRCEGQVLDQQIRRVQGGWMMRGQGELTIYYLSSEGERHFAHPFRFYQYIPSTIETPNLGNLIIRAKASVKILDYELLEDGSVVQLQYLGQIRYTLFQQREMELITGIEWGLARSSRPILQTGVFEERLEQRLPLEEGGFFPSNRIRQIQDLTLDLKEYQVELVQDELSLTGEVEVQVRYKTGWGKERWKTLPLKVQMKEKVIVEGEPCQQYRAVPMVKGYEYMLTGHPQHQGQVELSINLELTYRLVGTERDF